MQKILQRLTTGSRRGGRRRRMRRAAVALVAALAINQLSPLSAATAWAVTDGENTGVATSSDGTLATSTNADEDDDGEESTETAGTVSVATSSNLFSLASTPMVTSEDGAWHFEAEDYYTKSEKNGVECADLQSPFELTIPLGDEFTAGDYLVRVRYATTDEETNTITVQNGDNNKTTDILTCSSWNWPDDPHEFLEVMSLSNSSDLVIKTATWCWVDWVELVPTEKKRVRWQAKEYVSHISSDTKDGDNYANMDPGDKIELTLDNDFEAGQYSLLLTSAGQERTYEVQVGGVTGGEYQTTGEVGTFTQFNAKYFHDDGFYGTYSLKPGSKLTILAPSGSYGLVKDVVLRWESELPPGYVPTGDTYTFTAASYATSTTDDGKAAVLESGETLSIPLTNVEGFKPGTYAVQMTFAGDGQTLTLDAGSSVGGVDFYVPTRGKNGDNYEFSDTFTAHGLNLITLTATDTLTITAGSGKALIGSITLTPNSSKRKRLSAKDCSPTGSNSNTYANMDPGESITITLDDSYDRGKYNLLMTSDGSELEYIIKVNGNGPSGPGEAWTYQTTGAGWGDIHDDGFQGEYELRPGDVITILAPETAEGAEAKYSHLYDVVLEWDPAESGAGTQGDAYVFEAEAYYNQLTEDKLGADMQPGTELKLYLSDIQNFVPGNYLIQAISAGNGQIMPVTVGNASTEMIFLPTTFGWDNQKIAESMETFYLTGDEVLTLTNISGDKYTWIDKVLLVPAEETRIRLTMDDPAVKAEYYTGDNGNCADMKENTSVTITLDDRFAAGPYELLMFHCGFARSYQVLVNGQLVDSYEAPGKGMDGYGTDQFETNGFDGYYELKPGDVVTIQAPSNDGGWIKEIVWRGTAQRFYKKDEATGIVVEAEAGTVPLDAKLSVKALGKVGADYFSDEDMRATGYRIELSYNGQLVDLTAEGMENAVQVTIPLPAGYDKESEYLDLYFQDGSSWENLYADSASDGNALTTAMVECGVYAISMEKGVYHYEAEDYYSAWTDGGKAANFETGNGDAMRIPLNKEDGFDRGVYNLLVRYCGGGGSSLLVNVNAKWVGDVPVPYTGDDSWGDYRLTPAEGVFELYPSNLLEIFAPKNQYHWIDYVRLVEAEPFEDEVDGVEVTAAVGALPPGSHLAVEDAGDGDAYVEELYRRFQLGNITARYIYFYWGDDTENHISPSTTVQVRMPLPDGMDTEESYCLYYLEGSGMGIRCVKIPSTIENGYLVFSISGETGLFAVVEGAALLPAGYDSEMIYGRTGARVAAIPNREATEEEVRAASEGRNKVVKTRTEGSHYYYEGEGYYKAQFDSLTGDLQPGAQMQISLSDNKDFHAGKYTLTVRSNGNRQKLIVKVNNRIVGYVYRAETSFDMSSMTEDVMVDAISLSPSDTLTIEGETGGYYGWVDYVKLSCISASAPAVSTTRSAGRTLTYKGSSLYEKKVDSYDAADLQPGEAITFQAGVHQDFAEGDYQLAVTSNGNRARLWVKVNGEMVGSIVRAAGSGFEATDFTTDVMHHTLHLRAEDVISIEAPGNAEEGPFGWVETIQLLPAPAGAGEAKAEYRYDGEDFYQASLYSPAADLQPGTSIVFPVSNDPDFVAGSYRLSVLSNGTRERFDVLLNGIPVGIIRRKATDYSEIDYSQDYLDMLLNLQPGDVLAIVGQDGDFYGWVNYILLEKADR